MRVFRRRRIGLGKGSATSAQARREVRTALARAEERAAATSDPVARVQLIAQITTGRDYEKVRSYWLARAPQEARTWPEQLGGERFALHLFPVAPRTSSQPKLGRMKPITPPAFATFDATYDDETALAVTVVAWLQGMAAGGYPPVALEPPVLERWIQGRRAAHRVVDFARD